MVLDRVRHPGAAGRLGIAHAAEMRGDDAVVGPERGLEVPPHLVRQAVAVQQDDREAARYARLEVVQADSVRDHVHDTRSYAARRRPFEG